MESEEKKESTFKSVAKEIFIFILIAVGIVLPFRIYMAEPYIVSGASMDPTFESGDYLIVNKISYRFKNPERNTVVIFRYPNDTSKNFIKRIIGLPNETVVAKENTIRIINKKNPDGFEIDQSYIIHNVSLNFEKTLGPNEYFVMGDHRTSSNDSRIFGSVPGTFIYGKAVFAYWPVNHFGAIPVYGGAGN